MALTHAQAAKQASTDGVVDLVDVGTTDSTGDHVFMTSGDAEVATVVLANPAYGAAAASGIATLLSTPLEDASATGGTIALFKQQDRDNTEILRGSVTTGGGGGDIEMTSVIIVATEAVELTSLTYQAIAT